jgi:subtilisin family serine protease
MSKLHDKLMGESSWYNAWHSHKGHGIAHWFLFFFIAILITSALTIGLNKNFLNAATVTATKATFPNKISESIPGQYIIVFKDDVKDVKGLRDQLLKDSGGQLVFAYSKALKGFSAKIPDVAINSLKKNPNIKYVEQEYTVHTSMTQTFNLPYGLDRIDQPAQPIDLAYNYNYTGLGVHAYVIDTGILSTHSEFWQANTTISRVGNGFTLFSDSYGTEDCNGHGTYVAGIIAGKTYGVAKDATLHSVRAMNCDGVGGTGGLIAGIDWIINNHISPSVANMSDNFSVYSQSINDAVSNLVNSGVTVSISAGNGANDSCTFSPASTPLAITVGAVNNGNTSAADQPAFFSSYGSCLDIYAPGVGIESAWNTSDFSTAVGSGTSASSPYVAGVAALYLEANPNASPTETTNAIKTGATSGALTYLPPGSPNLLLNSLFSGVEVHLPDFQAPTVPASFIATSSDYYHINLSWASSTDNVGVIGYRTRRSDYEPDYKYGTSTTLSFIDNNRITGQTAYRYVIQSYDAAGNYSALSNPIDIITPAAPTPVVINSYSVSNLASTSVNINWQTNSPTVGTVSLSNPKQPLRTLYTSNYNLNQSLKFTGLTPKTSYTYSIYVNSGGGNSKNAVGTFKTLAN